MKNLGNNLAWLAVTAWVGSMWAVGYLAVPVLFQTLSDKMLAGMLAGKMFTLVSWVGIVSALYLLAWRSRPSAGNIRQIPLWLIVLMLVLALIGEFGIQPVMADLKAQVYPGDIMHSELAGKFKMLHGIASISYLVQSLLGAALILKMARPEQK